jgi:hypothetical protein
MADVSVALHATRSGTGIAIEPLQSGYLVWTAAIAAMMLALMAPALWNGFPLIFSDTGGYLSAPMLGEITMGRSALYGLFLYAGIPFAFWPNVAVQVALTVWLIVLTLRALGLGGRPWPALGIVAILSVGTSLPWVASQLIPDILFPDAVLALYLLAFHDARLSRWERIALVAVIAITLASHMAALGLCAAIIAALWLLARIPGFALPKPRLALAASALAAGIALCPISNLAITGNFAFTPGGNSFLFGRLLEDGIVARYLDDQCPDPTLRLCAYRDELPTKADRWLWGDDTPFYKNLGGWQGFDSEEHDIILATIARYPLMHVTTAVADSVRQLFTFKTEVSTHDNAPTIGTFADQLPHLLPPLMSARQQTEGINPALLNLVHVPFAALSIVALAGALIFRLRIKLMPQQAALCAYVLIALAANATICGVFSHPVDRYQSRLVPLAVFAVALLIAQRRRPDLLGLPTDLA